MSETRGANATTVARVINLSVSRVHALAQEPGFPPKLAPGEFDLQKVTLWYIRYLQAELTRRGPSGGAETADILAQRARLLNAQATQVEKRNAIDLKQFISADEVVENWSRRVSNTKKRLLFIPSKVAPMLINQPMAGVIAEALRRELYEALGALASSGGIDGDDQDEAPADDAPADGVP